METRFADVCLSPLLYELYIRDNTTVVMVDAIRASAVMVSAFMNGIEEIIPFTEIDEVAAMGQKGYLTAGERNGIALEEFDFGNSPLQFNSKEVKNRKLAMTTTNGTFALRTAEKHKPYTNNIMIGSFLNISAVAEFLSNLNDNILILCAGWKGGVNIEDSFFAGRLLSKLKSLPDIKLQESANLTLRYSETFGENAYDEIMKLSPRLFSKREMLESDIRYCLREDLTDLIPFYSNNKIRINP